MIEVFRDRYEVAADAKTGGEAMVVRAVDRQHDRSVALKIRPVHGRRDELLAEARVLLSLRPHPNLPIVRDDFFDGDRYIVVMDWVDGTDLDELVRRRGDPGLTASVALGYLEQAAAALDHLHGHEPPIVHGDVKPANLIVDSSGRVVLVDFGLSTTSAGGTLGFTAPEVRPGARAAASDVYSLAATAVYLLTGRTPQDGRPSWEGLDPARAEELERAVRMGLATDPSRRPASASELVERLRAWWAADLPRGVVTFLMTDIEGSTRLWEADPVGMAASVESLEGLIADAVERQGGRLIKSRGEGDSTLSVFASPSDAVLAARVVRDGAELPVRLALHTGEAQLRAGDYFGSALARAARIRSLAAGGQVLLSSATAGLASLPDNVTVKDLGPHVLAGIDEPERIFALTQPSDDQPLRVESPYQGLVPFDSEHRDVFFGREALVDSVLAKLRREQFVILVGSSGNGKSSVLRAGVIPRLWSGALPGSASWPVVVMTPGETPASDLRRRLDAWREARPGKIVVAVDQFEELFTLCDDRSERETFVEQLTGAFVLAAIRADFYGRLADYPALARLAEAGHVLVGAMSDDDLRHAIEGPALASGLRVEPALTETLLHDVAREPGALPLLSHALLETWRHREGGTLTLAGYHTTGGVSGAIAKSAESVFEALGEREQATVRNVFLRLTELGEGTEDTRRTASLGELRDADRVLQVLADARLITIDGGAVDVAHEALIRQWPRLRGWLEQDRDRLRALRHLSASAKAWEDRGRDPAELYRGARLAGASELASDELSPSERDFIEASKREQTSAVRRLRRALSAVAVALVLALVAGGFAVASQRRATNAAALAEVRRMSSQSEAVRDRQPDVALLLALEANRLRDDVHTRGALLGALGAQTQLTGMIRSPGSGLESAVWSPDGTTIATPTFDGILLWDAATRRRVSDPLQHQRARVESAAFSRDGSTLFVPDEFGSIQRWDVLTRRFVGSFSSPVPVPFSRAALSADGTALFATGGDDARTTVAFDTQDGRVVWGPTSTPDVGGNPSIATDGSVVAISGSGGTVRLADARTGEMRDLRVGPQEHDVTAVAFAADGTLAAGTQEGTITFWDVRAGTSVGERLSVGRHWVMTLEFSPDGTLLAAGSGDGQLHLWKLPSHQLGPMQAANNRINDVSFSADGTRLAAVSYDRSGAIWDLSGRGPIARNHPGHTGRVSAALFDGEALITTGEDGAILRHVLASGEIAARASVPGELFTASVRRGLLVTAGTEGKVRFWDAATLREHAPPLDAGDVWVDAAVLSPDARTVAVGTDPSKQTGAEPQGDILFVDVATRRVLHTAATGAPVISVAFDPSGRRVVASQADNTARVWDVATGRPVGKPMRNPDANILGVSMSGDLVATGAWSGRVELWDWTSARHTVRPMESTGGPQPAVELSPDAGRVASTTLFGVSRLWDVATGLPIGPDLVPPGEPPNLTQTWEHLVGAGLSFNADGTLLASGSPKGVTTVWSVDPAQWRTIACQVAGRNLTNEEWRQFLPAGTKYRATCPEFGTGGSA